MSSRITEPQIRDLVFAFYDRVRLDPLLGPVFEDVLDAEWASHLEKMCDFWSSILLATGRFQGNPVEVHKAVPGISPAHFDRWLTLFGATASEVLPVHLAMDVLGRATRMRLVLETAACP